MQSTSYFITDLRYVLADNSVCREPSAMTELGFGTFLVPPVSVNVLENGSFVFGISVSVLGKKFYV